jgi:hypothetical protein
MNLSKKHHPVIDVYNQYRTARLNVKYLEYKLVSLRRANFCIELLIAISASSTVAGIWVLQNPMGQIVWKTIIGVTAILAVAKPLLDWPSKIQKKEELLIGYRSLDYDIQNIIWLINQRQGYDAKLQEKFLKAMEKKGQLVRIVEDTRVDEKLRKKCFNQVLQELPMSSFFIPKES